jgi:hypothetical protein
MPNGGEFSTAPQGFDLQSPKIAHPTITQANYLTWTSLREKSLTMPERREFRCGGAMLGTHRVEILGPTLQRLFISHTANVTGA